MSSFGFCSDVRVVPFASETSPPRHRLLPMRDSRAHHARAVRRDGELRARPRVARGVRARGPDAAGRARRRDARSRLARREARHRPRGRARAADGVVELPDAALGAVGEGQRHAVGLARVRGCGAGGERARAGVGARGGVRVPVGRALRVRGGGGGAWRCCAGRERFPTPSARGTPRRARRRRRRDTSRSCAGACGGDVRGTRA